MRRNLIETILGGVVLVVAGLFLAFAYKSTGIHAVSGYELFAKFDRIDGLKDGGDVRMSGIKVGTVIGQSLDPKTYLAVVRLSVDPSIRLPLDSAAEIVSDGLLGGKYMSLVPGAEEKMIEPGGEIKFTQSPLNLESLISQFMFSSPDKDKPDKDEKPAK